MLLSRKYAIFAPDNYTHSKRTMRKSFIYLHCAVLLAGGTGLFGRLISLSQLPLVWYRIMFALAILLSLLVYRGQLKRIGTSDVLRIGGCGMLMAIHWVLFYGSIQASNVSIGVICLTLVSFFTSMLEPLFGHRRPSLHEVLISLLPVAGILLIFHLDTRYRTGIVLGVFSSAACALFSTLSKRVIEVGHHASTTMTLYELIGGFVLLTACIPFASILNPAMPLLPTWSDLVYLLLLSSIFTVGAFLLQMKALHGVSAFTMTLTYNLEPVYSILFAIILFDEGNELSRSFWIGVLLIVISVSMQTALARRSHRRTLLIYIIGIISCLPLSAQIKVAWTPESQHQLNVVNEADGIVTRKFTAYNTGDYSWQVVRGYTSCGCTKVNLQQEQMVRPGDSTLVIITFDPKGKSGPFREVVTVQLTDGEDVVNESITLTGEVQRSMESIQRQFPIAIGAELRINTDRVDFGEVRRGQVVERHLAICNLSAATQHLKLALSSAAIGNNTSDNETTITISPGDTYDLCLSWNGSNDRHWGSTHETLTLINPLTKGQMLINLSAVLLPQVNHDPAKAPSLQTERRISIMATSTKEAITQKLTIQNTGNAPLQVLRIYSEKTEIEVPTKLPLRIEPQKTATVEVRFVPGPDTELPVTIISDDARRPRQTVRLLKK